MLLHPMKCKTLVVKACIGGAIGLKSRSCKEAKCSKAIIQRHVYDASVIVSLASSDETCRISGDRLVSNGVSAALCR
jgi:hypothetical protein